MVYIKKVILGVLLLFVLVLCGTAMMKILDAIFGLGFYDIGRVGLKVGFLAWIFLIVAGFINKLKKENMKEKLKK